MSTQHPDWQQHLDASGDKYWTAEYLGVFAAVVRVGQLWEAKVWLHGAAPLAKFYDRPWFAMASMTLAIEASVSA